MVRSRSDRQPQALQASNEPLDKIRDIRSSDGMSGSGCWKERFTVPERTSSRRAKTNWLG
jgi:hypothetical protein